MPKLIPSWLAGTFDNDKSVARAAADALDETFATPVKKDALWKIYRDAVYERVEDSLLLQTAATLSDERNTSQDDAEAKYVRVVGTALRLASQLVTALRREGFAAAETWSAAASSCCWTGGKG